MEKFEKFDQWARSLELDWGRKEPQAITPDWLKERNDPRFRWAWNHTLRKVVAGEKKDPLSAAELAWIETLDTTVESVMVWGGASSSNEFFWEVWNCVLSDFQLLARASRLDLRDPWLDQLRVKYESGRFPRGTL